MTFEQFEVVRVVFPFSDRQARLNRPALILSDAGRFNAPLGQSIMAMITSARHSAWPLDHPIGDLSAAGLPVPPVIRFKLFTLDHRLVRGSLGHLAPIDRNGVVANLRATFGLLTPAASTGSDASPRGRGD